MQDVVVRLARADGSDGSKPAAEGPERTIQGICLDAHESATLLRSTCRICAKHRNWSCVIKSNTA